MADVSIRLFDGDERGQLMIVMSLAIALMFVSMALYLNTAIFTENLATRKGDIAGTAGAEAFKSSAADAGAGSVHDVNRRNNSTGYTDLEDAYRANVRNWSDAAGRLAAVRSRAAAVNVVSTQRGSRVVQVADRNFTNASEAGDWVLAEDVPDRGVRDARFNVTRSGLATGDGTTSMIGTNFRFNVTDGTEEWHVYVYEDTSNDIAVSVDDPSTSATIDHGPCSVNQSRAVVDVTGETVGGEPCPALSFFDNFSSGASLTLTFNDTVVSGADTVVGTYSVVVNETRSSVNDSDYVPEGDTSGPFVTTAVYSSELLVVYETARVEYATVVRVAPGEPDG